MRATSRVLIIRRGRVLAIDHGGDAHRVGLPGGGIEPGEHPRTAAARELYEETGLVAKALEPLMVIDDERGRAFVWLGKASGRLRSSNEGRARWAEPEELVSGKHGAFYLAIFESLCGTH